MIADPQFLAEAKQSKLEVRPQTGVEVQAAVNAVAQFPADVMAQTAGMLNW